MKKKITKHTLKSRILARKLWHLKALDRQNKKVKNPNLKLHELNKTKQSILRMQIEQELRGNCYD